MTLSLLAVLVVSSPPAIASSSVASQRPPTAPASLQPSRSCDAADRLADLTAPPVPRDHDDVDPALTRAFRELAYCDQVGPRTHQTAFPAFVLAMASAREADAIYEVQGAAATAGALVETWAASQIQATAGDVVSAMVGMAVEREVVDQLTTLAPALPAEAAAELRQAVAERRAARATPTAAGALRATRSLPGLQGWVVGLACRASVGPVAADIDAAFAAGDRATLRSYLPERGWLPWPGESCRRGLVHVLVDAIDDLERLHAAHATLDAAFLIPPASCHRDADKGALAGPGRPTPGARPSPF